MRIESYKAEWEEQRSIEFGRISSDRYDCYGTGWEWLNESGKRYAYTGAPGCTQGVENHIEMKEERNMKEKRNVLIECETRGFDEATQEVETLAEAYDGFPAQVQVKGCKDCTINIYPSQTKFVSTNGDEERQKGYEDGYDDGCMDMIDDEEEEYHG